MAYWLVKSEPDAFSWDQQVSNRVEPWTGVRNHTAKLNLKAMKKGDRAFFYHSNEGKEIVGVVEVDTRGLSRPDSREGRLGGGRHEGCASDAEAGDARGDQGRARAG